MKASELSQMRKNRADVDKNQTIDNEALEGVSGGAEAVAPPPIAGTIGGTIGAPVADDPLFKKTL